ncbi:insulinase family protein [candidate division KSB1 bacterium]|nr:insulinase family protein [candidate division KSB1 bacterium]
MNQNKVRSTTLDNGIRIISERMPWVRSAALGIWVQAGSLTEQPRISGISHFLEHMLFKGTKRRSARDIALSLETVGGSLNASTGKETTIYTGYCLDEYLPLAVEVLADMIRNASLQERDILLEKEVVLAEISHSLEDPEEMVMDRLYENLFPHHPIGYPVLGTRETVASFSRADLYTYLQQRYTGDRIVFSAAGRIEHDAFVEMVQQATAEWDRHEAVPVPVPDLTAIVPNLFLQEPMAQQAHIAIGAHAVSYLDNRRYTLALLDVLLGGGMSSRLFQNIREKYGFAYSVYSFTEYMADTGIFGLYMACDPRRADESIELLFREIDEIRLGRISQEELESTKSQIKGSLILSQESSSRRMRRLGEQASYNMPYRTTDEVIQIVEAIGIDDLVSLAQTLLNRSQFSITLITPKTQSQKKRRIKA